MSGAPTSGAEGADLAALLAAGWSEADLTWERLQEEAAEKNQDGDRDGAAALWAEALRLARANFVANDPRLATSLANQAHAQRQSGNAETATPLFEEALLIWDASGPWVEALQPERRARSSTFHLRLEAKHPGGYARHSRERYRVLAAEGRAALQALSTGAPCQDDRLARWRKDKPEGFTGGRKIMAAVLLMAPGLD